MYNRDKVKALDRELEEASAGNNRFVPWPGLPGGPGTCEEMVLDLENTDSNVQVAHSYGSELAGNFGLIPCGKPVVWGGRCEEHKVERRGGKDRRGGKK
jgi:hypothetical protein